MDYQKKIIKLINSIELESIKAALNAISIKRLPPPNIKEEK